MLYICECMFIEQSDGSSMCKRCRGDIYACECPMTHSIRCPEHPDFDPTLPPIYHK